MKNITRTVCLLFLALILTIKLYAAVNGNIRYEPANERITVSCLDHKSPQVRVLNPVSGTIVVVDCEREK